MADTYFPSYLQSYRWHRWKWQMALNTHMHPLIVFFYCLNAPPSPGYK